MTVTATEPATNNPPTASLSASPTSGDAPLTVSFTLSESDPDGDSLSCTLDFGDGSSPYSGCGNTSHTYQNAGTYTATYTVSDGRGGTGSDSVTVTATEPSPNPPTNINIYMVSLPYNYNSSPTEKGFTGYGPNYYVGPKKTCIVLTKIYWDSPTSSVDEYKIYAKKVFENQEIYLGNTTQTYFYSQLDVNAEAYYFGVSSVHQGVESQITWTDNWNLSMPCITMTSPSDKSIYSTWFGKKDVEFEWSVVYPRSSGFFGWFVRAYQIAHDAIGQQYALEYYVDKAASSDERTRSLTVTLNDNTVQGGVVYTWRVFVYAEYDNGVAFGPVHRLCIDCEDSGFIYWGPNEGTPVIQ